MGVTMAALEARLDPASFLRVHRRFIVNMDHVAAMTPIDGSRFEVRMRDGNTFPRRHNATSDPFKMRAGTPTAVT